MSYRTERKSLLAEWPLYDGSREWIDRAVYTPIRGESFVIDPRTGEVLYKQPNGQHYVPWPSPKGSNLKILWTPKERYCRQCGLLMQASLARPECSRHRSYCETTKKFLILNPGWKPQSAQPKRKERRFPMVLKLWGLMTLLALWINTGNDALNAVIWVLSFVLVVCVLVWLIRGFTGRGGPGPGPL